MTSRFDFDWEKKKKKEKKEKEKYRRYEAVQFFGRDGGKKTTTGKCGNPVEEGGQLGQGSQREALGK